MTEGLSDIEVLALQCRSENARRFVEEAIRCYRAGAYRASIVSTWIAVVFDLVDKIRELSVSGDVNAGAIYARLEQYLQQIDQGNEQGIKSALEFERNILKTCRDSLQFFDQHQYTDLDRLRADRHRCAHPSFQQHGQPYQPSAEQARLHLRNAVHHVMALPPIQGKAALTALRTLVTSAYFPDQTEQAVVLLRASPLGRPTDSLARGFVDMLMFDFVTTGRDLFGRPQVGPALRAALSMHPAQVEPRVRQQISKVIVDVPDDQLAYAVALFTYVTFPWEALTPEAQQKVIRFVEHAPPASFIGGLRLLHPFPALSAAVETRIAALSREDLASAISAGAGGLAVPRALQLVSESRNWDAANAALNLLIRPLFDVLSNDDITTIIRMPTSSGTDLLGAHQYSDFIRHVASSGRFQRDELRILLEQNGAAYLVINLQEPGGPFDAGQPEAS
ncbi:hypothetical protein [Burkholderia gladioli]|uniref:hypothetical protein n=1 Tax=Burkholderia gladioli TaxID=28095 RepID=UPI001641343F|nr:hypothetical protein [Burkholderia gladioli]